MSQQGEHESRKQTRIEFIRDGTRALVGLISGGALIGGCVDRSVRAPDDLDELRKTDPASIGYRESRRFETGFAQARGLATGPNGALYVAGDREIRVFSPDGKLDGRVALGDAPECLAFDSSGTLFIGMGDHVEVRNSGAERTVAWPSLGERTVITSVSACPNRVWVADAGNRRAVCLDLTGQLVRTIGRRDAAGGYPGLNVPSPHMDVAADEDGTVYVGNPGEHRVEVWSHDGVLKRTWGEYGTDISRFCGCCNPTDFAVLPDGRFVTSEKGLPRVKVYSAGGEFQCVVAGADTFAEDTAGIDVAADRDGHVIVLDPKHSTVRVYSPVGGAIS